MQQLSRERELWGDPSIKGNLDQVHAGKLLYGFFKARKTGILTFNDGANDVWVFLAKGCVVPYEPGIYAQDDFAWHLVRFGLVGEQEYDGYRKRSRQANRPLVQMLIDQRLVDADAARKLAHNFYERNLIGLFSWRHGTYSYFERPNLNGYDGPIDSLRTVRWIIDGIRKQYHAGMIESRLEKRAQTPLKVYSHAVMPMGELLISGQEQQIGEWVKQGRTIAQILAETKLDPKEARALIFALLTVECIKFESKGQRPRPAADEGAGWRSGGVLERLYHQAEQSVDRIREQVRRDEELPRPACRGMFEEPPAAFEEAAEFADADADDPTHLLRKRIQDKIRGLQEVAAKLDSPEGAQALASRIAERLKTGEPTFDDAASAPPETPAPAAPAPFAEVGPMDQLSELAKLGETHEEFGAGEPPPTPEFDLGDLPSLEDGAGAPRAAGPADAFGEAPGEGFGDDFAPSSSEMDFPVDDPPEQIFKLGLAMAEQEQYASAYRALQTAIERGYEAPEMKIHLGWTFYHAHTEDPERFGRAAELLQDGIEQAPKSSLGFLMMGRLYLAERDRGMAELYFVKALELDRDCREARDFIRQLHSGR